MAQTTRIAACATVATDSAGGDDGDMASEARYLTQAELAREADVEPAEIDELVAVGVLGRDAEGRFVAVDVARVRLAHALREGGITPEDMLWAIETERLPIDRVAEISRRRAGPTTRSASSWPCSAIGGRTCRPCTRRSGSPSRRSRRPFPQTRSD